MKKYKSLETKNWRISKPIEYKEFFKKRNLYWDTYKEYEDLNYHISYQIYHSNTYFLSESVIHPDKYTEILYNNLI